MFIAEIDPSQIAVQTGLTSTAAILQLVVGGDAVLSSPSAPLLTGKNVRLEVSGRIKAGTGATANIQLYFGDSTSDPLNISFTTTIPNTVYNFAWTYDFAYDSVVQTLLQPLNPQTNSGASPLSVAAQTDIQFVLVGTSSHASDPSATITITSFRMKID